MTYSKLETRYLPDFDEIKNNLEKVENDFTCYLNADNTEINFVITADEFLAFNNWNDLAKKLNDNAKNAK